MNSLEDLNNYGNTQVEYQDDRAPSITFLPETPTNQAVQIYQSSDHRVPVGTDIVEIINYDVVGATYTIDISAAQPGSKVVWDAGTVPAHCTVAEISPRIFRVSGLKSEVDWQAVKSPTVQMPETQGTDVTYTAYITYNTSEVKQWTVAVDVIPFDVLSYPSDFIYPNAVETQVTGHPRLYDSTINNIIWTVKISPSVPIAVGTMRSAGTLGGTSTFAFKQLTITGTREQVNSHLENLFFTSALNAQNDIVMSYRATNNTDSRDITRTQTYVCENILYLGPNGGGILYSEDVTFNLVNYPQITDPTSDGSGTYTLTITANPAAAVRTMTNTGAGGSAVFDNVLKRLTITGTRTQINSRIGNTTVTPAGDYTAEFALDYQLTTPNNKVNANTQGIYLWTQHDEISNISTARRYDNDIANILFSSNQPQITDLDEGNPTYTITLSSPIGKFGATEATAVTEFTYSGSKTQVNSLFTTLVFVPNLNQTGNSTFNYTQKKNGFTQVTQNGILLNGPWIAVYPKNPTLQTVSGIEGGVLTLTPGTNIIATNSPPSAASYTVNVSSIPGATVNWTTVPSGTTVTNPSAGIYTISGIDTVAKWNTVKSPQVRLPNAFFGSATFTSTLSYPMPTGTTSRSWNTNATITNQEAFSAFTTTCPYFPGTNSSLFDYVPRIIDDGNQTPTWTVVMTPSEASNISSWYYSVTGGGTASVNATTKVLTISGTKTQVNLILDSLGFTPNPIQDFEFTLAITASNNLNSETASATLNLYSIRETILKMTRSVGAAYGGYQGEQLIDGTLRHVYYAPIITGSPLISDTPSDSLYSAYLYPNNENSVEVMTVIGNLDVTSAPYYELNYQEEKLRWDASQNPYNTTSRTIIPRISLSGDGGTYIVTHGNGGYDISYCNSLDRWSRVTMTAAGYSTSPAPTLTPSAGTSIRFSAINFNGTRAVIGYANNNWFIERSSATSSSWTQMTYSTVVGTIQDMDDAGNTALIDGKVMIRAGNGTWSQAASVTWPSTGVTSGRISGDGQYIIVQNYILNQNTNSVNVWKRVNDTTWTNTATINNAGYGTAKGADINYDGTVIVTTRGYSSPNNQYVKAHYLSNGVVQSSEEIWYPRDFFGRTSSTFGDVAISNDGNTIFCAASLQVSIGGSTPQIINEFFEFRRAKNNKWFVTPTERLIAGSNFGPNGQYNWTSSGTMVASKNGRAFAYVQDASASGNTGAVNSVYIVRREGKSHYYSNGKFRIDGTKTEVNNSLDKYSLCVVNPYTGPSQITVNFDVTLSNGTRSIRRQKVGE